MRFPDFEKFSLHADVPSFISDHTPMPLLPKETADSESVFYFQLFLRKVIANEKKYNELVFPVLEEALKLRNKSIDVYGIKDRAAVGIIIFLSKKNLTKKTPLQIIHNWLDEYNSQLLNLIP